MSKYGLTEADYAAAAADLGCEVAAIKAVDAVESRGSGFIMDPDDPHHGEPTILFERHIFHRLTGGRWSNYRNPADTGKVGEVVYPYQNISWPRPGGYGPSGGRQHDRLARAVALDRSAALQSASWGRYQIMGFNYELAGFDTLQAFINAMYTSEAEHLKAFVSFVKANGLDGYLRSRNWTKFAAGYNGRDHWKNNYAPKLSAAYKRFKGSR